MNIKSISGFFSLSAALLVLFFAGGMSAGPAGDGPGKAGNSDKSSPHVSKSQQAPVVAVTGISHESNSFSVQLADLDQFNVNFDESPAEKARRFFNQSNPNTREAGYRDAARD